MKLKQRSVDGFLGLLVLAAVLGLGCAPRTEEKGVEVAQAVSEPSAPSATAADAADELERAAQQADEQAAEQKAEQAAEQKAEQEAARELAEREEQVRAREAELARQELAERERRLREREREVAEREAQLKAEQERAQVAAEAERQAAREAEEAAEAARAREAADRAAEIATEESPEESAVEPTIAADGAGDREGESWTGDEPWRRGSRDEAVSSDEDTSDGDRAETAAPSASPELLRAGMRLDVEIDSTLSSGSSQVGEEFKTVLVDDVRTEDGTLVAPAGSEVWGEVVEARPLRKVGGQAALGLSLDRLVLPSGETVEIQASLLQVGKNKKGDKAKIAGAVIAGAILGSILGDSDGALVGAAAGAAASTVYVIKAEGREVEIPAGTVVTLEIDEVVTVRTEYRNPR